MQVYFCTDCGYEGDFDDFSFGCCPCCDSDDIVLYDREAEPRPEYDLDQCLDLGECPFDMGEF